MFLKSTGVLKYSVIKPFYLDLVLLLKREMVSKMERTGIFG